MSTIQVFVRQVYGNALIYPANESARVLAQLTGTKTLTTAQLELARDLGCTLEYVADVGMANRATRGATLSGRSLV